MHASKQTAKLPLQAMSLWLSCRGEFTIVKHSGRVYESHPVPKPIRTSFFRCIDVGFYPCRVMLYHSLPEAAPLRLVYVF